VGDGAFSSRSAGSRHGKSGVGRGVMDRVGGVREPNALRGGGIVARSSASGGEGEEISIDNVGDW
jgi:hypothetical protein